MWQEHWQHCILQQSSTVDWSNCKKFHERLCNKILDEGGDYRVIIFGVHAWDACREWFPREKILNQQNILHGCHIRRNMHYTKWTWLFSIHIGCWHGFWKTSHTNQWLWARYSSSHQAPFKKIGANWWAIQESSASVVGKQVTKIYCSHCNHSLRTWCRCGCINCRRGLICCFSGSRKCIWGNWQKRKCRQRAGWKMCCQCNRAQKVNANEQKGGLQRLMKQSWAWLWMVLPTPILHWNWEMT